MNIVSNQAAVASTAEHVSLVPGKTSQHFSNGVDVAVTDGGLPIDELDALALQLLPLAHAEAFLGFLEGTSDLARVRCYVRGKPWVVTESEPINLGTALGLGSPRSSEAFGKVIEVEPFNGVNPALPLLSVLPQEWVRRGIWTLYLGDAEGFYGVAGVCGTPGGVWDPSVLHELLGSARSLTAFARLRYQHANLKARVHAVSTLHVASVSPQPEPASNCQIGAWNGSASARCVVAPVLRPIDYRNDVPVLTPHAFGVEELSPREREVASMLAKGYSGVNIAAVCELSENTVRTYIRRLYRKLGVSNRAELVSCVIEMLRSPSQL